MAESLKQKTVKGLIWSGVERILGQAVSFALALILARLVTPADYGTLAIVMVFVTLSGVIVDAGFANALIRKVDCTDVDRSTVLYFNIIVSILIYGVLYVISPFISNFYNNEDLTTLIRCASVVVVINSFSIVQQATLMSRIDFKKQTVVSLVSSITSGIIGIYLAYQDFGVWALVSQTIILYTIRCIMLWCIVRWKPLLTFSKESFKDLFGYSSKLMISNLISTGGREFMQLMLGRFFPIADLGYYNYANRIGTFLPANLSTTIQRVIFPVFSQIQDNDDQLAFNFRRSLVLSMAVILPIMFAVSALAEPIIELLLTDEWLPTIPLLRVIAITMGIWPLLFFNMNILWVKKRSDLSLKLEIINLIIRLSTVFALYKYGILWVSIALCIAEFLNFILYACVVRKVNSYGLLGQLKDVLHLLLSVSIPSLFTYYFLLTYIDDNIIQIFAGGSVIFVVSFICFVIGNNIFREFVLKCLYLKFK